MNNESVLMGTELKHELDTIGHMTPDAMVEIITKRWANIADVQRLGTKLIVFFIDCSYFKMDFSQEPKIMIEAGEIVPGIKP